MYPLMTGWPGWKKEGTRPVPPTMCHPNSQNADSTRHHDPHPLLGRFGTEINPCVSRNVDAGVSLMPPPQIMACRKWWGCGQVSASKDKAPWWDGNGWASAELRPLFPLTGLWGTHQLDRAQSRHHPSLHLLLARRLPRAPSSRGTALAQIQGRGSGLNQGPGRRGNSRRRDHSEGAVCRDPHTE